MNNKIINSRCICKKALSWTNDIKIMLEPCEHILHKNCIVNKKKCPLCKTNIITTHTIEQLRNKLQKNKLKSIYQKYIDMIAVSNYGYCFDTSFHNRNGRSNN